MIDSVAQLLEGILATQLPILGEESKRLQNPGMIGDMYEGLTRDLMERAVFDGLGLRIAKGKIRNSAGDLSRQIDCMIVVGGGEPIP